MTAQNHTSLIDILKNLVTACEANGLRNIPYVNDARNALEAKSNDPSADLVAELRSVASRKHEEMSDHRAKVLLLRAADTLENLHTPSPQVGWETQREWEMEQEMFHACGRSDVPEDVRKLVGKLWKEYCRAAQPAELSFGERTPELAPDVIELARTTYVGKVAEYDRDFEAEGQPDGLWEQKYGTPMHATYLGQQYAMKAALDAVFSSMGITSVGHAVPPAQREERAVRAANLIGERVDFDTRIGDFWSDAAKDMAYLIANRPDDAETEQRSCFIVDFALGDNSTDTRLFDYHTQQPMAEAFCKQVKDRGGAVNIKTRSVGDPRLPV